MAYATILARALHLRNHTRAKREIQLLTKHGSFSKGAVLQASHVASMQADGGSDGERVAWPSMEEAADLSFSHFSAVKWTERLNALQAEGQRAEGPKG